MNGRGGGVPRKRSLFSTLAALALAGGLATAPIVLVAGPAEAAPLAPVITAPSGGFQYDGLPYTVVGTNGVVGDDIEVLLDDNPACHVVPSTAGPWNCVMPATGISAITVGTHSISATQTDQAFASTSGPVVAFTVTAAPPSIDASPASASVTENFTITGTGIPGGQVTLSAVSPSPVGLCSSAITVDSSGNWACGVAAGTLGDNTWQLEATQTVGGGTASSGLRPMQITSPAPGIAFVTPADNSVILDTNVTVSGTTTNPPENSAVYISDVEGHTCTAAVSIVDGTWSCQLNGLTSAEDFNIDASFVDGGTADATATASVLLPPTVTGWGSDGNGNLTLYEGTTDFTLSGTAYATPGTQITVTIPYNDPPTECTATTELNGAWSCTFSAVPVGTWPVTLTQQPPWSAYPSLAAAAPNFLLLTVTNGPPDLVPTVDYTLVSPDFLHIDAHGTTAVLPLVPGDGLSIQRFGFDVIDQSATPAETCRTTVASGSLIYNDSIDANGKYWFACSTGAGPGAGVSQMRIGQSVTEVAQFAPFDYILEPVAPTKILTQVNPDLSVTISGKGLAPGTGQYGTGSGPSATTYGVTIWDGVQYAAPTVCAAANNPVAADGTWSCTIPYPGAGDHTFVASQKYLANWNPTLPAGSGSTYSALSTGLNAAVVSLPALTLPTVPAAPTPAAVAPPTPAPIPPTLVWTLHSNSITFESGDPYKFWSEGLPPGSIVDAEIHSTPTHLGSTIVAADGTFSLQGTIPESVEPGKHTVIVTVAPAGQVASPQLENVTVTPHAVTEASPPPLPDSGSGSRAQDRNSPTTLSSFTTSLVSLQGILANPAIVAVAFLGALALFLLVAFPAELVNSTFSEQYERFTRLIPGLKRRPEWLVALGAFLERAPIVGGTILTVIASIIFSFSDPDIGFDLVSARVILACIIALFIVGYVANTIAGGIIGRRFGLDTVIELKPLALILTVVGVIMSRLLNFSPGFLIGLLLAIAILGRPTRGQEGKSALIKAGIIWALGVVAWVAYSLLSPVLEGSGFAGNLTLETLVAISAEGLTALLVGMLPFTFLEGSSVWAWNKLAWIGSYILFAFTFALIVLPGGWHDLRGSIWVWGSIIAAFAVACIGIYLYFRFVAKPLEKEETEVEKEEQGERV